MIDRDIKGAIFDLDGVVTASAHLHSEAWKAMFDEFMIAWAERTGEPFHEFTGEDYLVWVDGKPRYQGVKSFMGSRGIDIGFGDPEDPPDRETFCGLGNRKNELYQALLAKHGAKVYDTSVALVRDLLAKGVRVGVASSSKNTELVLKMAGLETLFETRVCGVVSAELGLKGKPDPDIFVQAASNLGLDPWECMMVEDAVVGVIAGERGNFGLVLGVARHVKGDLLSANGADLVVSDLGEISTDDIFSWFREGRQADAWSLTYRGFHPDEEKLREALTTVGNGYLGTRGCFECERAGEHHYPGTYLAGLYNKLPTTVHDRQILNNDYVNCPNWLLMEFRVGRGEFRSPLDMEILSYRHGLNMRDGVVERTIVFKDQAGHITRLASRRIASMVNPHCVALEFSVTPLNYFGPIAIRSGIDGDIINDGVARYRQLASRHLEPLDAGQTDNGIFVKVRTNSSKIDVVCAARISLTVDGRPATADRRVGTGTAFASETYELLAEEGRTYKVDKLVGIYTSREVGCEELLAAACRTVGTSGDFEAVFEPHKKAWHALWQKMDMEIDGDRFVQKVSRLHAYHMVVVASTHNRDIDAGMPARGLHGEAYRGHVFWDDVYIFPFYNWHFPEVTRALLMYRYRRLDSARSYAREHGYEGAMYPWQTADDGGEETQVVHYNPVSQTWGPDLSRRQRHVSIAIFYTVDAYCQATGDRDFLENHGAEMMLDIARFWGKISRFDERTGRFHIEGVMGPDEYHEKYPGAEQGGLKDNAYTNIMVVWLLEKALRLVEDLPPEVLGRVAEKIGFRREEISMWKRIVRLLNVPMQGDIICQHDGYMDLEELDWDAYRNKYGNIHRMDRILKAEGDSPNKYKVTKQADVLMTFYLLSPEEVRRILNQLGHHVEDAVELLRHNYQYYLGRTSHGSTLSKVVHAAIARDMGSPEVTWQWFSEAMASDVRDTQGGTTPEGIHCGVMAGSLGVIVRNFAGVTVVGDTVSVQPGLPPHWKRLAFSLLHKGTLHRIEVTQDEATVTVQG